MTTPRRGKGWRRGPREAALEVLAEVIHDGRSLTAALKATIRCVNAERDAALVREICFGVMRWLPRLEQIADELLERPLRRRDADVRLIILIGIYQLEYTRIPAHAAVHESVRLTHGRGKAWASGLVNGVLRRLQRERGRLREVADRTTEGRFAHPSWLVARVREAWPSYWREILAANNTRAAMTLRVNLRSGTRAAYLERLASSGIEARTTRHSTSGVTLEKSIPVARLPAFDQGQVSVQDEAAQLAAGILLPGPGERLLDACAAPGGKTAHLFEVEPGLSEVWALDSDPARLSTLEESLRRLGAPARLELGDATDPETWWDGIPFDRILLDAPCSATGVIRRHPDIKRHRRDDDIATMREQQLRLLQALWPLLARGGRVLYATCSILPDENEHVIRAFLATHEDAVIEPIEASWGHETPCGRQILPGEDGMDGFYYARLDKG